MLWHCARYACPAILAKGVSYDLVSTKYWGPQDNLSISIYQKPYISDPPPQQRSSWASVASFSANILADREATLASIDPGGRAYIISQSGRVRLRRRNADSGQPVEPQPQRLALPGRWPLRRFSRLLRLHCARGPCAGRMCALWPCRTGGLGAGGLCARGLCAEAPSSFSRLIAGPLFGFLAHWSCALLRCYDLRAHQGCSAYVNLHQCSGYLGTPPKIQ